MNPHHEAWLAAHPERTAVWLAERIADGFDVHHVDGDRENNAPDNLILIEHTDHMSIHGLNVRERAQEAARQKAEAKLRVKLQKGESAYALRESGLSWPEVAAQVYGGRRGGSIATNAAKAYAQYHGLPWPIEVDQKAIFARLTAERMARLDEILPRPERWADAEKAKASEPEGRKVFNYREAWERGRRL
jgi:hypothetical protein